MTSRFTRPLFNNIQRLPRTRPTTWSVATRGLRPSLGASFATARPRPQGRPQGDNVRIIKIPRLPLLMIGIGFACLGVGLYEYLTSDIQKYPPPIRQALRKALYYQQPGKDVNLSTRYFKEALELALQSDEMERDGAPLTGIMIQYGALLESLGRYPEARQVLTLALRHLVGFENDPHATEKKPDQAVFDLDLASFPPQTQRKIVGIAQKLGDIAQETKHDAEAEKWYTWSLEHLLRISSKPVSTYGDTDQVLFDKEHMPAWLTHTELGAALEALGTFYQTRQKHSLAVHLYLRTLTLAGLKTCQSSVIMNNLSESFAAMGQFDDAKLWAQRGLEIAQNPNTGKANKDGDVCDEACGVLLFNMGMLFEQTNDKEKAMIFYEQARNHGRKYKLLDCIRQADRAIRRLQFEQTQPPSLPSA
ncbi:uncharacterized protein BYT42DRAFT_371199 [Radiomyces spectabilis]|uniref:uncharacterized protein n=1 Tax=Radiomyces spectabilis TaxID=64574 RepID=UPI00221F0BBD|nr:uncharacterized protein BYT42DRAFT_371199 [Radiomyces spectabilis]KAI8376004.1 hypothetical protein BYT42DRAFT_371199 [Radiomyces spectabilis]